MSKEVPDHSGEESPHSVQHSRREFLLRWGIPAAEAAGSLFIDSRPLRNGLGLSAVATAFFNFTEMRRPWLAPFLGFVTGACISAGEIIGVLP